MAPARGLSLGLVLAGGRSVRMGTDKAFLIIDGLPMALHAARVLAATCDAVAMAGGPDAARLGALRYADAALARDAVALLDDPPPFAGQGPLAGILAGLIHAEALGSNLMLTAPCDVPGLPRQAAASLMASLGDEDAAFIIAGDQPEPLVAAWRVAARPAVEAALRQGERSPLATLRRLRALPVPVGPDQERLFANLNTPEDLKRHRG